MRRSLLWIVIAAALTACGGQSDAGTSDLPYSADLLSRGENLYHQTCFACHGPDGKGLPGLGRDLTTSTFIQELSDEELLEYVLEGRGVDDPRNITGNVMPPKGGFDFLTNDDILAIIAFVRSIQE